MPIPMPMPAMIGHLRRPRNSTEESAPSNTPVPEKIRNTQYFVMAGSVSFAGRGPVVKKYAAALSLIIYGATDIKKKFVYVHNFKCLHKLMVLKIYMIYNSIDLTEILKEHSLQ